MDSDIAGKKVGGNTTQMLTWHCAGDDEMIYPIGISIVDMTIFSIVNAAISCLVEPSWNISAHWGCQVEADGDGGPYAREVAPIFHYNTAAGCIKAAMQ
jgi:hypothetical protein